MELGGSSGGPGKRCDEKAGEADCLKRGPLRRSGSGDDVTSCTVLIRLGGGSRVEPRRVWRASRVGKRVKVS
jgi:hypothetical protein